MRRIERESGPGSYVVGDESGDLAVVIGVPDPSEAIGATVQELSIEMFRRKNPLTCRAANAEEMQFGLVPVDVPEEGVEISHEPGEVERAFADLDESVLSPAPEDVITAGEVEVSEQGPEFDGVEDLGPGNGEAGQVDAVPGVIVPDSSLSLEDAAIEQPKTAEIPAETGAVFEAEKNEAEIEQAAQAEEKGEAGDSAA